MRLPKEKSRMVVTAQQPAQGKGNRQGLTTSNPVGKQSRLYESPEFKSALTDISTQFQDKVNGRSGKGDRQNQPDSPITKYQAENWMNRSKDKISTVRPQPKPKAR